LVDADTLYLGALRDGVFALGLNARQTCAAPGWHSMESQPALILAVLLRGATWVHIDLVDIEENTERLLEQPIDVLGVSRCLRDVLRHSPPRGEKPWLYWFRHPAESTDLTLWQDFIEQLQLQECYVGNLLWNSSLGGAIFFSARYRGLSHHESVPTAGLLWQFGTIADPELPCLDDSGRIALGKEIEGEVVWTATPHILALYLDAWHYLGNYPRGRAARTYLRDEVMAVLLGYESYIALIEVFVLAVRCCWFLVREWILMLCFNGLSLNWGLSFCLIGLSVYRCFLSLMREVAWIRVGVSFIIRPVSFIGGSGVRFFVVCRS